MVFIDGPSVADTIGRQLRAQAIAFGSVECGELPGEPDATGECTLVARNGTQTPLTITVTDVNRLGIGFEYAED